MKFSSLDFKKVSEGIETASVKLSNGYVVNISRGNGVAHTYMAPYEVSMSPLDNRIMDDSVGYLSEKEVKQLINEISNLPKLKDLWKNSSTNSKYRGICGDNIFPSWDW